MERRLKDVCGQFAAALTFDGCRRGRGTSERSGSCTLARARDRETASRSEPDGVLAPGGRVVVTVATPSRVELRGSGTRFDGGGRAPRDTEPEG